MNSHRIPPSHFLRNPITGECRAVPAHEARRLRRYDWEYISLRQFKAWQVSKLVWDHGIRETLRRMHAH